MPNQFGQQGLLFQPQQVPQQNNITNQVGLSLLSGQLAPVGGQGIVPRQSVSQAPAIQAQLQQPSIFSGQGNSILGFGEGSTLSAPVAEGIAAAASTIESPSTITSGFVPLSRTTPPQQEQETSEGFTVAGPASIFGEEPSEAVLGKAIIGDSAVIGPGANSLNNPSLAFNDLFAERLASDTDGQSFKEGHTAAATAAGAVVGTIFLGNPELGAALGAAAGDFTADAFQNAISGDRVSSTDAARVALALGPGAGLALLGTNLFASGRDERARARDDIVDIFKDSGFATDNSEALKDSVLIKLADGSQFDARHFDAATDFEDPLVQNTIPFADAIALGLGAQGDISRSELARILTAAAVSNANGDQNVAFQNLLTFVKDFGLTAGQIEQGIVDAFDAGEIDANQAQVASGALDNFRT